MLSFAQAFKNKINWVKCTGDGSLLSRPLEAITQI